MNRERIKTVLAFMVCAGCLIFTGWAFATIQQRQAIESGPVPEYVHQQRGMHV